MGLSEFSTILMPFRVSDGNARLFGLITFGNYLWREMPQTGQDRTDSTDDTVETGQTVENTQAGLTEEKNMIDI